MRFVRNAIFWTHLVVGLSIALVVAGLAGTGLLMAFERQIVNFVELGDGSPPRPDAQKLDVETLLTRAQEAAPDAGITGLTMHSDPAAPVSIALGRDRRVQLNAYTGVVVGAEAPRLREFFHTIEQYHRWLAMTGNWRERGKAVTGAAAILLAGQIVSGLFLWFPRSLRWNSFRAVLLFNWQLRGKARDWNWHHVVGFWILVPLLVIALSSVVMSYDWANRLLFAAVGETPPLRQRRESPEPAERPRQEERRRPLNLENVNLLWGKTRDAEPAGWRSITMNLSGGRGRRGAGGDRAGAGSMSFVVTRGNPANPMNRKTATVNQASGEIIRVERFADQPPGRRARSLILPIHSGEIAGAWGQAIAALASLGCLVLVYTGFALSYRRFFPQVRVKVQTNTLHRRLPAPESSWELTGASSSKVFTAESSEA